MKRLPYSHQVVTPEDIAAVTAVLRSDYLTQGPQVELFEQDLARYLGAKHVVAVNSGTAALHLAVLARGLEREPVYMPTLTFVATANAVLHAGGSPVLVDVAPDTLTFSGANLPSIGVDLFGQPLRDTFSRPSIVDAAHSLGAKRDWSVGTYTLSFHPVKTITTGEGGAIVTDDDAGAETCRLLRAHGRRDGEMVALGFNYRMSDISAALGRSQLQRVDEHVMLRRTLAVWYREALADLIAAGAIALPKIDVDRSAHHLFPVLFEDRETRELARATLAAAGIETQVHYPPVHLQPYYRERFGYRECMFPVAEDAARRIVSLPLWPGMDSRDVAFVTDHLRTVFAKRRKQ